MFFLGIDPGSSDRTGFAIKTGDSFERVESCELWEFFEIAKEMITKGVLVVIEDPNMDSTVFRGRTNMHGITLKDYRQDMMMAQSVGKNKGVASAILTFFAAHKVDVLCIAPSSRKQVTNKTCSLAPYNMPTKCSHEQFIEFTKYGKQTNEHGRDAAMLIATMTSIKFNVLLKLQKAKK